MLLQKGNMTIRLCPRQIIPRILFASTVAISILFLANIQSNAKEIKRQASEDLTNNSSKAAMTDPNSRTSNLNSSLGAKVDTEKNSTTNKVSESKQDVLNKQEHASNNTIEKSNLSYPTIPNDAISSLNQIQFDNSHIFPSAIDIQGSPQGILLHAQKSSKFDLLNPLSIWLENGPLLVSVRHPSELVLVATKFGDVCVTTGGDALVERDGGTLRIANISVNKDTVFLNIHDKQWLDSPWSRLSRLQQLKEKNNLNTTKKRKKTYDKTYENIESGALSIAPGYELLVSDHNLDPEDLKPEDSVGRRDFRPFEGGKYLVDEVCVFDIAQIHELVKNLKDFGSKANTILSDITRNAAIFKSKQGELGFEKVCPAPPKPEINRKTPPKIPPKSAPPALISAPKKKATTNSEAQTNKTTTNTPKNTK